MARSSESSASLKAFVIGPIGDPAANLGSAARVAYEDALEVLETVIRPACEAHDIEVIRADLISKSGEITDQIYRALRDTFLVIADLTGANPNVSARVGRHC